MILALLISMAYADLNRLQELDKGIYRSSQPGNDDIQELCNLGIRNIISLNGADSDLDISKCDGMKIIYNEKQSAKTPVSASFLNFFDDAVKEGNLLFHCSVGSHRTGRLAAFFRMKYNGWSSKRAIKEMKKVGKYMWAFPMLDNQVRAMNDFILNKKCSEKEKYCIN